MYWSAATVTAYSMKQSTICEAKRLSEPSLATKVVGADLAPSSYLDELGRLARILGLESPRDVAQVLQHLGIARARDRLRKRSSVLPPSSVCSPPLFHLYCTFISNVNLTVIFSVSRGDTIFQCTAAARVKWGGKGRSAITALGRRSKDGTSRETQREREGGRASDRAMRTSSGAPPRLWTPVPFSRGRSKEDALACGTDPPISSVLFARVKEKRERAGGESRRAGSLKRGDERFEDGPTRSLRSGESLASVLGPRRNSETPSPRAFPRSLARLRLSCVRSPSSLASHTDSPLFLSSSQSKFTRSRTSC